MRMILLTRDEVNDAVITAAIEKIGLDPELETGRKVAIIWMMEREGGVEQVRVELKE